LLPSAMHHYLWCYFLGSGSFLNRIRGQPANQELLDNIDNL
jgi:hypothetical protein